MTLTRVVAIAGAIAVGALAAGQASAATQTFDTPVVTGPTPAPGVWYTDRYAPAAFTSPVSFGGDNRLLESLSVADDAANRPPVFSTSFYDTQGRKFDFGAGVKTMSIDLYVPSDWASTNQRMAGFWGSAFDNTASLSAFPIVEFTSDGGVGRFEGWDSGTWVDMGLPTGFAYDTWNTLSITLSPGTDSFTYRVGDKSATVDAFGSTSIGNTILEGYNKGTAYNIYWDNLSSAVPEPSTWATMIFGLGLAGLALRRRGKVLAAAA